MTDIFVPVKTEIPAAQYRKLHKLAEKNGTTVARLVAELVNRSYKQPPAPARRGGAPRGQRERTTEMLNTIREMFNNGATDEEIAARIDRSVKSVENRRQQMGLYRKSGRPSNGGAA